MCKETSEQSDIPWLVQPWLKVYNGIPDFRFPGTQLSISFMLISSLFLLNVRVAAEQVLIHVFHWPATSSDYILTTEAAASVGSITHSTILCPVLYLALRMLPYRPSAKLEDAPKWYQQLVDAMLQFCTGYMVYDTIVNIVYLRWQGMTQFPSFTMDDYLFLGHHFVTAMYMTQARVIKAGHQSAMMCMLLGELTNPFHNSYFIAERAVKLNCCNGPRMQSFFTFISIAFAATYNLMRVIVAPIILGYTSYDLAFTEQGRKNIPFSLRIFWNVMIWGVIFGSSACIIMCHGILVNFFAGTIVPDFQKGVAHEL